MGGSDGVTAHERRSAMLARIASIVGCPVETLWAGDSAPDGATAQAAELLRHWLAIPSDERWRVLELARSLADQRELV